MTGFISFAEAFKEVLEIIIGDNELHAKWLNTLSFLENCGARKIAACEHPTLVKEEMLKHAAEEFRHAFYLKQRIEKIYAKPMNTYSPCLMLGGISTFHYLNTLDLKTSQYLKKLGFSKSSVKEASYLLVTFAIELRAAELYPIYDTLLRKNGFPITVKSILLEEEEHLQEMKIGIKQLFSNNVHSQFICRIESEICHTWIREIEKSIRGCTKIKII
jgi:hypothetical protein